MAETKDIIRARMIFFVFTTTCFNTVRKFSGPFVFLLEMNRITRNIEAFCGKATDALGTRLRGLLITLLAEVHVLFWKTLAGSLLKCYQSFTI